MPVFKMQTVIFSKEHFVWYLVWNVKINIPVTKDWNFMKVRAKTDAFLKPWKFWRMEEGILRPWVIKTSSHSAYKQEKLTQNIQNIRNSLEYHEFYMSCFAIRISSEKWNFNWPGHQRFRCRKTSEHLFILEELGYGKGLSYGKGVSDVPYPSL